MTTVFALGKELEASKIFSGQAPSGMTTVFALFEAYSYILLKPIPISCASLFEALLEG